MMPQPATGTRPGRSGSAAMVVSVAAARAAQRGRPHRSTTAARGRHDIARRVGVLPAQNALSVAGGARRRPLIRSQRAPVARHPRLRRLVRALRDHLDRSARHGAAPSRPRDGSARPSTPRRQQARATSPAAHLQTCAARSPRQPTHRGRPGRSPSTRRPRGPPRAPRPQADDARPPVATTTTPTTSAHAQRPAWRVPAPAARNQDRNRRGR